MQKEKDCSENATLAFSADPKAAVDEKIRFFAAKRMSS
jgi:hypothetical protein